MTDWPPAHLSGVPTPPPGAPDDRATDAAPLAGNQLTAAGDLFRALFHANPVPSAILRLADRVCLYANQAYLDFYGLRGDQLIGQSLEDTFLWPDPDAREQIVATYRRDGRLLNQEITIRRHDGATRTVLVSDTPFQLDGQACTLATTVDITARKEMEERIREQGRALERLNVYLTDAAQRFRALFQSGPVPSVIYNEANDQLVDANPLFLNFFGLTEADLGRAGPELDALLDQAQRQQLVAAVPAADALRNVEVGLRNAAGEARTALVSLVRIAHEGQPSVLASFIDVTDLKQAENEVRRLASELTLAEQSERQRISTILHDDLQQRLYALQVLVTAARGHAEQRDGVLGQELAVIHNALRQAGELTRRLAVDLAPPILHGENLYHALLWLGSQMKEQFGLTVTVDLASGWRPLEQGLRIVLFQVVRELLFNVAKHAGVSDVRVTLAQRDDLVIIQVRDGGAGFDAARILSDAAGRNHGLAMIRQRMELYGGRLHVEARPGLGTTVTISVPGIGLFAD